MEVDPVRQEPVRPPEGECPRVPRTRAALALPPPEPAEEPVPARPDRAPDKSGKRRRGRQPSRSQAPASQFDERA